MEPRGAAHKGRRYALSDLWHKIPLSFPIRMVCGYHDGETGNTGDTMSQFPNPYVRRAETLEYGRATASVAEFLNAVYAWMCVGLATTAVVAWWVSTQDQLVRRIFSGGIFIALIIAELVLVWVISAAVNRISTGVATGLFLVYSVLNGLTLSVIFLIYSLSAITATFVVTAGMFGAMSLYGYVTKRDLTAMGSFLLMGLVGLILASIVNAFWANSALYWVVTYAGVVIFLGLTAYDTQKMKEIGQAAAERGVDASRLAIVGSLSLYLDFINLFLFMLRIMGNRRG